MSTVLSAAILIAAEVFGAAFAGGWALYNILLSPLFELVGLDAYGVHITQGTLFVGGIAGDGCVHPHRHARRAVHHERLIAQSAWVSGRARAKLLAAKPA